MSFEKSLINKENFSAEVLESLSDAFVSLDNNLKVIYVNKAAEKLFETKREIIIGKDILEAFPKGKKTIFQEGYINLLQERKVFEFESHFNVHPFDNWFLVRVFPYKNGFNIFIQDITQLKTAANIPRDHEHRWTNLISNLPGITYRCRNDENWTMEFISNQCKQITGYNPSDLINNSKIAYNDLILEEDQQQVYNCIQDAISKQEPYEIIYRIKTSNDEIKWVWERGFGVSEGNKDLFLEGFIEDITERKHAEDALKQSEERNRTILEKIPATVWMTDQKLKFISSLGSGRSLLGFAEEEVIGMSVNDFFNTEDPQHPAIVAHNCALAGESVNYSIEHNNIIWECYLEPSVDEEENVTGVIGVAYDVTKQKEAENLLKISEEKYRSIFENSMEGIFQSTLEGRYISVNPSFARIGGFDSPEEMINSVSNIKELYVNPKDRAEIIRLLKSQEIVNNFETEIRRKDGSIIWIIINVRAVRDEDGKLNFLQGSIIDITQRKHAQETLRRSKERLRLIIDSSHDFIYSYNTQGRFTSANKSLYESMGLSEEEIIGKTHNELGFSPEQCQEWDRLHEEVYRTDNTVTAFSSTIMPDRQIYDYELVLNPLHDNQGNITGISGITRNITERKKAEKALKESEKKYRTLFESDPDYTILLDLEGNLLDVNSAATEIIGQSKEELMGKHFMDLTIFPPEELDIHASNFSNFSEGHIVKPYEAQIYDKNGGIRWIEVKLTSIKKDNIISYILIISSDITERKRAENEIKASLREKDVLLKEIHHRVKNNMQIISSLLNLQKQYVEEEEAVNVLVESQNRVKSMAMVHEKLYQSHDLTKINVPEYVKKLIKDLFYSYAIKEDQIRPVIHVDEIILNMETAIPCGLIINELVSNSLKYAFPNGREGVIVVSLKEKNDKYQLKIGDNGIGLPEGLDFKHTNSLGLQLVNSLAGQIDGELELECSQGTEFKITFSELKYKKRLNQ